MLRFEDRIFEQPIFKRALAGMGKCYSDLIEDPSLIVTQQLEKVQLTTMPASESQVVNISTTGENNQVMKLNDSTVDNEDDGEEPVALLKKSDDDPFGLEYLKGDLSAKFKSFNDLYSKFITSY